MMSRVRLTYEKISLKLINPFRLSYGVSEERQAFWLRLENDQGWGEGTIPPYYHVDDAEMRACWDKAACSRLPFPDDPAGIEAWVGREGPAPARTALELALHDRIARQRQVPLFELLGLPKPVPQPTSFTIAIDTPEAMAAMALKVRDFPVIKVKLGSEDDRSRLAAIRAARPDVRLRVDANAGWTFEGARALMRSLEEFNLELIEQPLPKEEIEGMGNLQQETSIPIVADESVQTLEDVERLGKAGVAGINLKLMKVGGLSAALRILKLAKAFNMKVMLGCMIETSLGTTAMAHLSGCADWLDLDAPMLISNDPFEGLTYSGHAMIHLPERPGIGVLLKTRPEEK